MDAGKWQYNMILVRVKLRHFSRALSNKVLNKLLCRILLVVWVLVIFLGMNYVFHEGIDTFSVANNPIFRNYIARQNDNLNIEKAVRTSAPLKVHQITKTISMEIKSSPTQVYLKIDGRKVYDNHDKEGRGIHVLVINQYTGALMSARSFDTCAYRFVYNNLKEFLEDVQGGRIIVFSVHDEASQAFPIEERTFLKEYGSREIDALNWRDMWIYVCIKKKNGFLDEVISKGVKYPNYGKALFLKVDTELQPKENDCDWINNPTNIKHAQFCSKRDGYGAMCRCNDPLGIDLIATPLLGSRLNAVPITILAAYRPHYLNRMLRRLLTTSGVNREMITIYIDGYHNEITDLANMYDLRYVEHTSMCNDSVCRISQHCKRSFHETFEAHPDAKYAIILEEDLDVAEDIMDYFSQLVPLLEEDESIYCISAWNDNAYENYCNDSSMLYRVETMPGLGWVLKRKLFKEELEPIWPGLDYPSDWDIWTRGDSVRKGRECIIPDVPRTFHFGVGVHVGNSEMKLFYANKVFNHETGIRFDRSKMTSEGYEKEMNDLIKRGNVVDHLKVPCVDKDFIPNTTSQVYIVYVQCKHTGNCVTWLSIAKCYNVWFTNVRGVHKGMWRLWVNGNHVIFVSNLSPYNIHKPKDVIPLYIETKEKA